METLITDPESLRILDNAQRILKKDNMNNRALHILELNEALKKLYESKEVFDHQFALVQDQLNNKRILVDNINAAIEVKLKQLQKYLLKDE